MEGRRSRVRGCLLGGAIGDALGWPVEFAGSPPWPVGRVDEITDDTQMTLFTVEALLTAPTPDGLYQAYQRWLATQSLGAPPPDAVGLASQPWLYAQRAPGNACLSGLRSGRMGTVAAPANPNSKGCGAVMRSAPFGLVPSLSAEAAFDLAVAGAVQTHGHPSGYLAAGAFAAMVRTLLDGSSLSDGVDAALARLPGDDEVSAALRQARAAAPLAGPSDVERLGAGWVAEEALAIGLACALTHPDDMRSALVLAVRHPGDSDSTGAICGNLLGVRGGEAALPADWAAAVEGRATILALADALAELT
jgi:ADP-ribosylglycohydrolase